jgi:hypothetical protein
MRAMREGDGDKPRVFIGSSAEGLAIAEAVQVLLEYNAECRIWSQGVFGLSKGNLESLVELGDTLDFAILVLTPDDLTTKRERTGNSPRDNVLFELGLFTGKLGRERTFMVYCRDEALELPSDLAGVSGATFGKRSDGDLLAALGAACTRIKSEMKTVGRRRAPATAPARVDSVVSLVEYCGRMSMANKRLLSRILDAGDHGVYVGELAQALGLGRAETLLRARDLAAVDLVEIEPLTDYNLRSSKGLKKLVVELSQEEMTALLA